MNTDIKMTITISDMVNYAQYQNKIPVIRNIVIENQSNDVYRNIILRASCDDEIINDSQIEISEIPVENSIQIKDFDIDINSQKLSELTERIQTQIRFQLICENDVMVSETEQVTVLAFDEWQGISYCPELVAAFVTPNDECIAPVMTSASEYLKKWTQDPSFDGYQRKNPKRILDQVASIYSAIKDLNITYSEPPASFENIGQRVRLCNKVLSQKFGTCLDLSLLFVSCMESVGLHTLLLFSKGHVFPGVWLEEDMFPNTVSDDPSIITKKMAYGINEIVVVEATAMTSGKSISFDNAVEAAKQEVDNVFNIIDIKRARVSGVKPLPVRIKTANGWEFKNDNDSYGNEAAPNVDIDHVDIDRDGIEFQETKLDKWEKKLLDLGLRNPLVSMKFTGKVIPLISTSLSDLEDSISSGNEYAIAPRPLEWHVSEEDKHCFEKVQEIGDYRELIKSEYKCGRLRSFYTEGELNCATKDLYRTAKKTIEENGANCLYLALGVMKWYESEKSERPRYSPLILLPVDLIRCGANKGYKIRMRDEESVFNVTLLEYLKVNFDIIIGGLDPLPTDDYGIDVTKIFSIVRSAIMNQKKWDIIEAGFLGVFSFSQFVMWNDLKNRSEDLMKNKIVKSLMEGHVTWETEDLATKKFDEKNVLLPISVDASQLYAIEAAEDGQSFVLHGPPGTGKSQTITAMIANALANDKTVLFVAEKMAALSVVQNRLNKLGLDPFCLELHSNKSKKKDVLEQLEKATEVKHYQDTDYYDKEAEKAKQQRFELDKYDKSLHQTRKSGMSVYQMISEYESIMADDVIQFSSDFVQKQTAESLSQNLAVIRELLAQSKLIGNIQENQLSFITATEYSQSIKNHVEEMSSSYRESLITLKIKITKFEDETDINKAVSYENIKDVINLSDEINKLSVVPIEWMKIDDVRSVMTDLVSMCEHYIKGQQIEKNILEHFKPEILTKNGNELSIQWENVESKKFISHYFARNSFKKSMKTLLVVPFSDEMIAEDISKIIEYQKELELANQLNEKCKTYIGCLKNGQNTSYQEITELAKLFLNEYEKLSKLTNKDNFIGNFLTDGKVFEYVNELHNVYLKYIEEKKAFYSLMPMQDALVDQNFFDDEVHKTEILVDKIDDLKDYIIWNGLCKKADALMLEPVTAAIRSGMNIEYIENAYKKGCLKQLIIDAIDTDPVLNKFSGSVFNEQISQFKDIAEQLHVYAKQEIYCRLASKVPDFAHEASHNSELGILQRAIKSNGRGLTIRKLFEQIPDIIPRLCPCMLMSPLSAAQYLDPKREPFDIVVFDEASQLTTCKAIGAIARGKNAVIVGDPKQMPPTSFFSTNKDDDDDVNEDLESILDDCLAIGMPQAYLRWHYRSRHESLIAFSNNEFYENGMYTFPSYNDRDTMVRFVHVDGIFERGKSHKNSQEARAVVDEIIRRSKDPDYNEESIGVVTFNISQQNLIDDMVEEERGKDPEFEAWYTNAKEEMFIKNLENVQGDERDVILFSIGYGPDKDGKISMNFGPINREGGWRRLNVAVSRARKEMTVFSSMNPEQIDESRSSSQGVHEMKAFLQYAKNRTLSVICDDEGKIFTESDYNGIADRICERLKHDGYETNKNIGHSKFRVDIGIINPDKKEEYIAGILLDGYNYKNSNNTQDREVSQINVLNGLGWNIYRIWTMDWWDNSNREYRNLLNYISDCEKGKNEIKETHYDEKIIVPEMKITANQIIENKTSNYKAIELPIIYKAADDFLSEIAMDENVSNRMLEIIDYEAPISENLIIKRLASSYGVSRAGKRIQEQIKRKLQMYCVKNEIKYTNQEETKIYWKITQNPLTYDKFRKSGTESNRRDIKDVPAQEIINAIIEIVNTEISIDKEALVKEAGKLLGYSRLGGNVNSIIEMQITTLLTNGRMKQNDKGYISNVD